MFEENENIPVEAEAKKKSFFSRPVFRVAKYLAVRVLTIAITIVAGIFITVLIANRGGFVDASVANWNEYTIQTLRWSGYFDDLTGDQLNQAVAKMREDLYNKSGLNLPPALRNLKWTFNVLSFRWGDVLNQSNLNLRSISYMTPNASLRTRVSQIILDHFPNTLLLIASADLIVFLIGIPLALFLSRKYGK